ncbi:hypothetical protein HDU87_003818 [Geranomyces variabilis]|uniref:Zn(2)-C6 fungal-type domain-containing protein n=1 Tax=Geranomyces variabilis TaxID=109894 RepID=A0AAD5TJ41_9FUNG|nr:hypothetical protein HDU87_003818 [Geranomyces variabilis]
MAASHAHNLQLQQQQQQQQFGAAATAAGDPAYRGQTYYFPQQPDSVLPDAFSHQDSRNNGAPAADDENDTDDDDDEDEGDGFDDDPLTGLKRKRVTQACDACNRKKIKCNGSKPQCANCLQTNSTCTYARTGKKRGPRAGYIESLENRLKEMEALLKPASAAAASATAAAASGSNDMVWSATMSDQSTAGGGGSGGAYSVNSDATSSSSPQYQPQPHQQHQQQQQHRGAVPPEATAELLHLFFQYLHPVMPLIHKPTFYANFANHSQLLLNAMYALAARFSLHPSIKTESCYNAGDVFYIKAREMVDHYMDVPNASTVTALLILANYAAESDRGSAAWMYSGMAIRMAQELKLNVEPDFEDSFAPTSNLTWLDKESRRRLWWNCFILDRYAGAAADRSMIINEKDCKVYLPSLEMYWESETGPSELLATTGPGGTNDTYQIAVLTSTNVFTPGLSLQSPYGYFVLLIKIFGKILEYTNLLKSTQRTNVTPALTPDADYQLTVLDASLRDWFSSLPEWVHDFGLDSKLGNGGGAPDGTSPWQTAYLHIFYHVCVIMLHRPKMSAGVRNGGDGAGGGGGGAVSGAAVLQNASFIVCLSSANAVAKILTIVGQTNPNFLYFSPFVGFCIFQSGLVHLLASQLGGRGGGSGASASERGNNNHNNNNATANGSSSSSASAGADAGSWTDPQLVSVISQAEYNVASHLAALAGVSRYWFMPSRLHAMLSGLAEGARAAAAENHHLHHQGHGNNNALARAILGPAAAAAVSSASSSWVAVTDRYSQEQLGGSGVIVPGLASPPESATTPPAPARGPLLSSSSVSSSVSSHHHHQQPTSASSTGMMAASVQQQMMHERQMQQQQQGPANAAQIQSAINMSTHLYAIGQPPLGAGAGAGGGALPAQAYPPQQQQQQHRQWNQQQQQQQQQQQMAAMGGGPMYPAEYAFMTPQQQQQAWGPGGPPPPPPPPAPPPSSHQQQQQPPISSPGPLPPPPPAGAPTIPPGVDSAAAAMMYADQQRLWQQQQQQQQQQRFAQQQQQQQQQQQPQFSQPPGSWQ